MPQRNLDKVYCIIPVFNEEKVILEVIREIQEAGYKNLIIVDDGSSDGTYAKIKDVPGVIALKHPINRGKGAAAKTGMETAKLVEAEVAITLDGDGQHNPKDIGKMLDFLEKGNDVVLGTRLKNSEGMPIYKIWANQIGNFCTWFIYGLWVSDSQSGFRAYSKKALQLIHTQTDRYEYDSEIIREINHHKLKYVEIPIEVRCTKYSMGKVEKQNLANGVKTLFRMVWSLIS